jgi:hypothetical protein
LHLLRVGEKLIKPNIERSEPVIKLREQSDSLRELHCFRPDANVKINVLSHG